MIADQWGRGPSYGWGAKDVSIESRAMGGQLHKLAMMLLPTRVFCPRMRELLIMALPWLGTVDG